MLVKDVLARKKSKGTPLGVVPSAEVSEAVKIMVEHDTGSCLVLENDELKGMVTFREVLHLIDKDSNIGSAKVSDIMNADPTIATPNDTVDQLRNMMTSNHIRYMPVMEGAKLIDVVSFYDIAVAVAHKTDFENRMLKQYIHDWQDSEE